MTKGGPAIELATGLRIRPGGERNDDDETRQRASHDLMPTAP